MCLENGSTAGSRRSPTRVRIHNRLVERAPRPRRRALRASSPTTSAASRPTARHAFYTLPVFTEWDDRLFVRCIPPLHLGVAAPPRRAPPHRRADARPSRAVVAWPNDPTNHVHHGAAARRHAVHQQLPRAPRPHRLRGRPRPAARSATSSACGSRPRCSRPAAVLRTTAATGKPTGRQAASEATVRILPTTDLSRKASAEPRRRGVRRGRRQRHQQSNTDQQIPLRNR